MLRCAAAISQGIVRKPEDALVRTLRQCAMDRFSLQARTLDGQPQDNLAGPSREIRGVGRGKPGFFPLVRLASVAFLASVVIHEKS